MQEGSPFSTSSPTFVVFCLVNFHHSYWCEVVIHLKLKDHMWLVATSMVPTYSATLKTLSAITTASPKFVVSCLVNFPHFHWCEVVSHCGFDLYFPDGKH